MSSRKPDLLMLGALVRLTYHSMSQKFTLWLRTSPYSDLQPAHSSALQALWSHHGDARLTTLARSAHITKQSMGALVDHLVRTGYVARVEDPDDRRASRLRLTARGRAFITDGRAFAGRLEADLAKRVGARRVRELRETLALILAADADDRDAESLD